MESSRGAPISGCTFDAMYIFDFVGQGAGGLEVLAHAIHSMAVVPRACAWYCLTVCVLFCGVLVPLNLGFFLSSEIKLCHTRQKSGKKSRVL